MKLPTDFRDLLCSLNEENVEYLLVGAWALAAHAIPRYTGDMDIYFRRTSGNVDHLVSALRKFGLGSADINSTVLMEPGAIVYVGHPPLRIDFLSDIDGIEFEDAWNGRVTKEVDGVLVPTISLEHLALNKRASGRPKDEVDLLTIQQLLADRDDL